MYCFQRVLRAAIFHTNSRAWTSKSPIAKLNAFYAEFEPIALEKVRPHQHLGVELLYLISGSLELTVGTQAFTLKAGDAVYFDSEVRHSYHRSSKSACSAVIVTA